jgi:hypothetical protein
MSGNMLIIEHASMCILNDLTSNLYTKKQTS